MKHTIGFDLGGTKLAAALVKQNGEIVDFIKVPINLKTAGTPQKAQKQIIQMMADIALDFKSRFPRQCSPQNLEGIGLASAGPMNIEKGVLIHPVNFPGWKIVPIKALLEKALLKIGIKSKVYFQNDAMAAALAEGWVGGARKMQSYAVITVGTGIGSGVILNGRPCQSKGAGSEFGHILLNVKNVQGGSPHFTQTAEGIASGTALLRRARELGFTGNSVEELVADNQKKYQFLYDDMSWALAALCYNLSIGFHLDGIFLSGGLIKIQNLYFKQTQKIYQKMVRDFNKMFEVKINIARTKNQAGVLGAAYLPWLK